MEEVGLGIIGCIALGVLIFIIIININRDSEATSYETDTSQKPEQSQKQTEQHQKEQHQRQESGKDNIPQTIKDKDYKQSTDIIMEKATLKAKRIKCIIGFIFLIPPILGVIAFILSLFDADSRFSALSNLSDNWSWGTYGDGGAMSATPIYFGLMALAGAYLIHDSLDALFVKKNSNSQK